MGEPTNEVKNATTSNFRMVCVQYVYFIVNFVFVIMGTLLIATASLIEWIPGELSIFMNWDGEPIRVLKLTGIALLILSIIANFTSIKQSFILFSTYGGLLLALLIVELNLAIRAFIIYDSGDSIISSSMFQALGNYNYITKTNWNYMQHYLHCCGIQKSSDWAPYHVDGPQITKEGYTYNIPYSCCADFHCYNISSTGCLSIVSGYVSKTSLMVLCTIISIGISKLLLLIFSCILIFTSTNEELEEIRESQKSRNILLDQSHNQDLNAPPSSSQKSRNILLDQPHNQDLNAPSSSSQKSRNILLDQPHNQDLNAPSSSFA